MATLAKKRNATRQREQQRLTLRVVHPVNTPAAAPASIAQGQSRPYRKMALGFAYVAAAVAIHAATVLALNWTGGSDGDLVKTRTVVEKVMIRDLPPPRPLEQPQAPAEKSLVEAPIQEDTPAKPKPKPMARNNQDPPATSDPIDAPADPLPADPTPARRVVGLSLESTVSTGAGPAFGVGNTRMGTTDGTAADPSSVGKLRPSAATGNGAGNGANTGQNAVATRIPQAGQKFVKPVRLGTVRLDYPPSLKARGVEGNVVVLITISDSGTVDDARVLTSSGYQEFDAAARKAALQERYTPATRGGESVNYTLKYTYRFRIVES
jgi:TonB family protein